MIILFLLTNKDHLKAKKVTEIRFLPRKKWPFNKFNNVYYELTDGYCKSFINEVIFGTINGTVIVTASGRHRGEL
jgi:hypothetical protein